MIVIYILAGVVIYVLIALIVRRLDVGLEEEAKVVVSGFWIFFAFCALVLLPFWLPIYLHEQCFSDNPNR